MCRSDPHLYGLSRDHYGLKPVQRLRPFEAAALAIASKGQRNHYLRATLSSIAEEHSYNVAYAGHTFCAFPSPETLIERKAKDLSREPVDAKQAEQLRALALLVEGGEIDFKGLQRRPTDELLGTLASIDGVGKLGAQLTTLFGFGRLECFPLDDPALQKWISKNVHESDKVDKPAVAAWTEKWGDQRGLVAMYIYSELLKNNEL
jgi:3-methyladenine DNA glycosylase/8-oxoguanine DNA glycosylase